MTKKNVVKSNSPDLAEAIIQEHRALAILRLLNQITAYCSNSGVISDYLDKIGFVTNQDELHEHLETLEREGLLSNNEVSDIIVVTLTATGQEVAEGRSENPHVSKPGPECPY